MRQLGRSARTRLLIGTSVVAILCSGGAALAQDKPTISIAPQPLASALYEFGGKTGTQVIFPSSLANAKVTSGVSGESDERLAMAQLLAGTGLTFRREDDVFVIVQAGEGASDPQSGSAAGDGADNGTVEALIVTAQKREENIQDVPIAMSAFTQEDLTRSQVAGGPDLITQVPNMTFTKTNFSSYSIQIRGIGTQAISATTDPAVAVAFNNTPFIRNRFFEQEFYDLQRVEVLRGPQGTLYGRNATGGVVNIISAKPKFTYDAKLSADLGNYSSSRLEGMVNIPLVEDKVALRVAGAWTKRDGYDTNQLTGQQIDGRDLWSTRVSLRIQPTDHIDANLIWEHFDENDDRLRSGKQLCKKDVVTNVAGFPVGYYDTLPNAGFPQLFAGVEATFSQGCTRGSLYSADAFQTPNGLMLPYYLPLNAIGLPAALNDPYASTVQSPDLRVIESTVDPDYRARSDLGELQISFDLSDQLTLSSETAYSTDMVYSLEDFNRFNTAAGAWWQADTYPGNTLRPGILQVGPQGGIFCDPQLGCSDRMVAVDLSTARSRQFSQEFRLASDFDGPFNFSLGANFLRYDTEDKYYVFINSLSMIAARSVEGTFGAVYTGPPYIAGETDNTSCLENGLVPGDPSRSYSVTSCVYIDPNPISSINDKGHNYFLSRNPFKLISYAVFGESYYKIGPNLKLTAGLRWTVDKKEAPRIPTWILGSQTAGYPVAEVIEQEWREPTGRLALDWKPDLTFTDETLLYASFAHGYKAGGANPPGFVRVYYSDPTAADLNTSASATRPHTFDPEFVNAFEVGSKNTILEGRATVNLAGFYYDYTGYQVSEIVDRSAYNRNFDATVWGVELESDWRPFENLRLGLKGGYEKTRIANGEAAVDLMDRTAGNPGWTLVRPFPTFASSCILPTWLFQGEDVFSGNTPQLVGLGSVGGGGPGGCEIAYLKGLDPVTALPYTPNPTQSAPSGTQYFHTDYPGWNPATAPNNGEGISKELGGNELPNAPHWTATTTTDYTLPLANDWLMTLHSDVHWQSQSWWRVFNDNVYDKLHPYFTMNLAAIFTNEDQGWDIMAYIKNVTDETAITGAFLNSDDTGLTTNVFLTEPRLYGLRVTKTWTDNGPWGWLGASGDGPYPLTVEISGQVQRTDAPTGVFRPDFVGAFPSSLWVFDDAQRQKFDWGDGRAVKLTYQPLNSMWKLNTELREIRANTTADPITMNYTDPVCGFGGPFASFCTDPTYYYLNGISRADWAEGHVTSQARGFVGDLSVGRKVGAGPLASTISLGLRYARFESEAHGTFEGVPDWYIPEGFVYGGTSTMTTHTIYQASFDATRKFEGAGPMVTWEAALPILDVSDSARLSVDWSLSGGALFGQRKTAVATSQQDSYYEISGFLLATQQFGTGPVSTHQPAPVSLRRSSSATVPVADASLGLAYDVNRFSISAGYRWERYFNATDGGLEEKKSYDRTFDGPYFKIAVGFGG